MRTNHPGLVKATKVDLEVEAPGLYEREHLAERPQMHCLKLRRQFIVRWENCRRHKVRLGILWTVSFAFVDKNFELFCGEFRDAHFFWSYVLETLLMRAVYQHHSYDISWVRCLVLANEQSTQGMTY